MVQRSLAKLEHAMSRLEEAVAIPETAPLAIDGTIQRFEFVFELFWKTLRRVLQEQSVSASTPRDVLRAGYEARMLADEAAWLRMLRDRNDTTHTYDEAKAVAVYESIKANMPAMRSAIATIHEIP